MIRRCAFARYSNARIHLFREGSEFTLCGNHLSIEYRVRPDSERVTCRDCLAQLPNSYEEMLEEAAS